MLLVNPSNPCPPQPSTPPNTAASPTLQRIVGGLNLPSWSVLALWLAEQRHLARSGGGSRWGPYLAVLPEKTGTVLDWKRGEVRPPTC
jgi:hypothetical protein